MKPDRSEFVPIRGVRYHVRRWGNADAPIMLLLHGYMDMSASYQFIVDGLQQQWNVIAPDWRGHGDSGWHRATYWLSEYLADLDSLIEHYCPERPVRIVAHSMGAYIAGLYAGIRPERVTSLVNIEGHALLEHKSGKAVPRRYEKWLDSKKQTPSRPDYDSPADFSARLMQANPRLGADRAQFLAERFTRVNDAGRFEITADPAHRHRRPVAIPMSDFLATRRATTAPVLCIVAGQSALTEPFIGREAALSEQLECFPDWRVTIIQEAGHNVHHECPEQVAALIEAHFTSPTAPAVTTLS